MATQGVSDGTVPRAPNSQNFCDPFVGTRGGLTFDPSPFPKRFVITALVALDCRTVPSYPSYTHSGRCRGRGRRTRGRVGPLAGAYRKNEVWYGHEGRLISGWRHLRGLGFGHDAESGHWLDTR
jgi:hypothetical protein